MRIFADDISVALGHKNKNKVIEIAKVIVTDYGFCCSFNVVPYSQALREEAMDEWHKYEKKACWVTFEFGGPLLR